jgi:hypothetical protein
VDAILVPVKIGQTDVAAPVPVVPASLPLARRRAGAREALLQAIVLRNFGVSHLVLGATRTDLKTADALLRNQVELGVHFIRGDVVSRPSWDGAPPHERRSAA